jgi:monodictyphenone polyketide synthase
MEWAEPSNADQMSNTGSSSATEPESLIQPTKLTLGYFSNEFPHDDLKDLSRQLYNHSKDRRHPLLARLIDEVTLALRDEVRSLPATLRRLVPPFETVFTLIDYAELRSGPLGGSVDGVLLCVVQLATFIGHYEDNGQELDLVDADACLAGLGTGLLSTAAVSLSPTLADVPVAAAQVIRIAFRLGVLVNEVSQHLQPRPLDTGPGDSWAYVVPDVEVDAVQKELDAIHKAEVSLC